VVSPKDFSIFLCDGDGWVLHNNSTGPRWCTIFPASVLKALSHTWVCLCHFQSNPCR